MTKKLLLCIIMLNSSLVIFFGCNKNKNKETETPMVDMKAPTSPEPAMATTNTPVVEMNATPSPEPAMAVNDTPTKDPVPAVVHIDLPPDAVTVEKPFVHQTFTLNGQKYVAVDSSTLNETKNIKGYEAPLQILAFFEENGTLARVKIASHKETPEFIERIEKEWLPKLAGWPKDKVLVGPGGIDALSEATLSTDAIRKTVDILRKVVFTQLFQIPVPSAPAKTESN